MNEIPDDALRVSWQDAYQLSVQLASMIEDYCCETSERFDLIVVVPRGSYYPVNIVAREFGFGAVDLLHACVGSYQLGSTSRQPEFDLGQMPTDDQVKGKRLLIIEEVCDSGHTLKFLTDRLNQQGAEFVRSGVLHYKPDQSQTDFVPDWYVSKTDKWIVYPWEENEFHGKDSKVRK